MAFRQKNFEQRMSRFEPAIEDGIRKNFSAYMDMVGNMSREAFAPYAIIGHVHDEKELLDNFKMAVDSLELLMFSSQAKNKEGERELLTKLKQIEDSEYQRLLKHREKRKWSDLPVNVTYGVDAAKQIGLRTDLFARAPDVFENRIVERSYNTLLSILDTRAEKVVMYRDSTLKVAAEYARQEREFPIYRDKFLEAQRKLVHAKDNPPAYAPHAAPFASSIVTKFHSAAPSAPPADHRAFFDDSPSRATTDSEHSSDDESSHSDKRSGSSSEDEASSGKKPGKGKESDKGKESKKLPPSNISKMSYPAEHPEYKTTAKSPAGSRAVSPAPGGKSSNIGLMGLRGLMNHLRISDREVQPSAPSLQPGQ